MNKIHVPKDLWTEDLEEMYSPYSLFHFKKEIDSLNSSKIRYKDHFLNKIKEYTEDKLKFTKKTVLPLRETKQKEIILQH